MSQIQKKGQILQTGKAYKSLIPQLRQQPNYLIQKYNQQKQAQSNKPSRAGGVYVPPHKLRAMQEEMAASDPNSVEYQRMMWELLRKSINGIVNKVNISNIQNVVIELLNENILRGKGLLARAIIKAQMASPNFTHVYAALIAVINTKLPEIGNLIIKRVMLQFKRSFSRNNKIVCMATTKMLAHLINQRVLGEYSGLQLLLILLNQPTQDSVQISCDFMTEAGQVLQQVSKAGATAIFQRLKSLLHEGQIDQKAQYSIQKLFAIRKTNYKEHPGVIPELDLVQLQDQITHNMDFDEQYTGQQGLNVFKEDPFYAKTEDQWDQIKQEILGQQNIISLKQMRNYEEQLEQQQAQEGKQEGIHDLTQKDLINLRRTIYLAIQSTVNFQQCAHKILKMNIAKGYECQLVDMIIQCSMMQRIYQDFFGLLAQRFCKIDDKYKQLFIQAFVNHYNNIFKQQTNKIRNLGKLFGHLFYTRAIDWQIFQIVQLSSQTTTAASRMFLKIIFREIAQNLGVDKMIEIFSDENLQQYFQGLFPIDHPNNVRFAINYFTSIGLGKVTEKLRQVLTLQEELIAERKNREEQLKLQELLREEEQMLMLIQEENRIKLEQIQNQQKQILKQQQLAKQKQKQKLKQQQKLKKKQSRSSSSSSSDSQDSSSSSSSSSSNRSGNQRALKKVQIPDKKLTKKKQQVIEDSESSSGVSASDSNSSSSDSSQQQEVKHIKKKKKESKQSSQSDRRVNKKRNRHESDSDNSRDKHRNRRSNSRQRKYRNRSRQYRRRR